MPSSDITALLVRWRDPAAREQLFSVIYPELRRIAAARMRRERSGHTLQPTALVNEAFLLLVKQDAISWQSRAHFLAIASEAMRRILVDHARRRLAKKRAMEAQKSNVDPEQIRTRDRFDEIIAINDLLDDLHSRNARVAGVFNLRYFGGLTFEEVGEVLSVTARTAKRDWQIARAWLFAAMEPGTRDDAFAAGKD